MKPQRGWVDPRLAEEFPHLRLHVMAVDAGSGRTPREVKARLRELSDRYTGGKAVNLRQQPVPWAYRVFFRQVGIDPDERRTPPEELALARMQHGGFRSRNVLDDAITIATVETGVGIVAFDADAVQGEPGLRLTGVEESLGGEGGRPLPSGRLVIADVARPLAVLFGDLADGCGVHSGTERMLLCGIQVKGVPEVSVEEALWIVAETVGGA